MPTNIDAAAVAAAQLKSRDDIARLVAPRGVAIELGVAEGYFAERVLKRSDLARLYGVDMYAGDRGHDVSQYKRALQRLAPFRDRHTLLRMRFDEAAELFPESHFDFIYVDGYAHDGEDGGRTFEDWYAKLKPGGVFGGDDYHPAWPLVVANVDAFIARRGLRLFVINCREETHYSRYPTWFAIKPDGGANTEKIVVERLTSR